MKFVESFYNIIIDENEKYVFLFNSYSGSLIKLEKEIYNNKIKDKVLCDCNGNFKEFNDLRKQGFIIPSNLNEFNRILIKEKSEIYSYKKDRLTIVIAPTMNCNLNCNYCFEKENRDNLILPISKCDAIINFIKLKISSFTKKLHITWFGGEPMIGYEFIRSFSERILEYLKDKNIEYTSSMISNGTLLDIKKIKVLVNECFVKSFQITMDGTKENYCSIKKASPKQFDKVMENIKTLTKYANVNIRLNANKQNFDDLKKISEIIVSECENLNNLNVYMARIVNYFDSYNTCNFSTMEYELKKIEFKKWYLNLINKNYRFTIPKYRGCYCGLFTINNYVIGPDCSIYKCEHDIGKPEKIIGDIDNGIYYNDYLLEFLNNRPLDQCKTCKLFPICLGGCPNHKIILPLGESCDITLEYLKYVLKQYIGSN